MALLHVVGLSGSGLRGRAWDRTFFGTEGCPALCALPPLSGMPPAQRQADWGPGPCPCQRVCPRGNAAVTGWVSHTRPRVGPSEQALGRRRGRTQGPHRLYLGSHPAWCRRLPRHAAGYHQGPQDMAPPLSPVSRTPSKGVSGCIWSVGGAGCPAPCPALWAEDLFAWAGAFQATVVHNRLTTAMFSFQSH